MIKRGLLWEEISSLSKVKEWCDSWCCNCSLNIFFWILWVELRLVALGNYITVLAHVVWVSGSTRPTRVLYVWVAAGIELWNFGGTNWGAWWWLLSFSCADNSSNFENWTSWNMNCFQFWEMIFVFWSVTIVIIWSVRQIKHIDTLWEVFLVIGGLFLWCILKSFF